MLNGILRNLTQEDLPAEIIDHAKKLRFSGSNLPNLAINWKLVESMAALKGFEAAMLGVILQRKYGLQPVEASINT